MARKTTMPIAALVEDLSFYPRHSVDEAHVASLVRALRAGAHFPPLIVDRQSKRIVDGWHRARAYRRVLGPEAVADVELREYANDGEMFLASAELNATHGRRLDRIDEVRIVTLAKKLGVDDQRIAIAIQVLPQRVEQLSVKVAIVPAGSESAVPGTTSIALKRPAAHLAGHTLTKEQIDAHDRAPGVSYLLIAQQLEEGVRVGLLDPDDVRLRASLATLHATLATYLAE